MKEILKEVLRELQVDRFFKFNNDLQSGFLEGIERMTLELSQEKKGKEYQKLRKEGLGPIDALAKLSWNIPIVTRAPDLFTDLKMSVPTNEEHNCLARVILCIGLLLSDCQKEEVKFGEVLEDWFFSKLMKMVGEGKVPEDEKVAQEALMYEDPHAVVVYKNNQFDPISTVLPPEIRNEVEHKIVEWEAIPGIAGFLLMNIGNSWPSLTPSERLSIRLFASEILPQSPTLTQSLISSKIECGQEIKKEEIEKSLVRKNLRLIFGLVKIGYLKKDLLNQYPVFMVKELEKEVGKWIR